MKRLALFAVAAFAVAALAIGVATLTSTETEAAIDCLCPDVYKPVICKNGKTYSNFCYARCDGAHGCKSADPF